MKESPHASVRAPGVMDMENFMQFIVFMLLSTLLRLKHENENKYI